MKHKELSIPNYICKTADLGQARNRRFYFFNIGDKKSTLAALAP
jgi:hypothetical protein